MASSPQPGRRVTIKRHRAPGGRVEGCGLVRTERKPGLSDSDARAHPLDRGRARLAPEQRGALALRRRVRTPAGSILARPARTLAVEPLLHGVPRRRRVRAVCAVDRADVPARDRRRERGRRSTGAGGRSAVSTASSCSTSGSTTRASRRSPRLGLPAVVVGGPLDDRSLACRLARRACGRGRAGALSRRSRARHGSHASRASSASCTARRARGRSRRPRADLGLSARVVPTDSRPRAEPARHASSCRSPSRRRRSPSTATSSPLPGPGPRSRWASRSRTSSPSSPGTTRSSARSSTRRITTLTRDIAEFGALGTRQLLALIDGHEVGDLEAPRAVLTPRGSTARPAGNRPARRSLTSPRPGRVAADHVAPVA